MRHQYAAIAQLVERIHGKDEVSGSSPDRGSKMDFSATESPSRAAFSVAARSACHGFFRGGDLRLVTVHGDIFVC